MKIILIVIDGLADEKIPALGKKTPLEDAFTPNLNLMASRGEYGLIIPFRKKGELPTSEDCHFALLGYNPEKDSPSRGVLEVLGTGEKILKSDLCLRANLASVNENLIILDRRAGRVNPSLKLIQDLNKIKIQGVKILIKKAFGYRLGIIVRGKNLSAKVSSNDPKKTGKKVLKITPLNKDFKSYRTAQILNVFFGKSHQLLKNHRFNLKRKKLPANYLLLRGPGMLKTVPSFYQKHRLKAAFIAGGNLYRGIARYFKMKEIRVKGANGLITTNLKGKILAAQKNISKYDFIFLHIKAADSLAEDGKFLEKKKFIEKIDQNLKPLLNLKNVLIVLTGDHATCSLLKRHCLIPCPVVFYLPKQNNLSGSEPLVKFSEKNCLQGGLGVFFQKDLMKKIFDFLAKDKKFVKIKTHIK